MTLPHSVNGIPSYLQLLELVAPVYLLILVGYIVRRIGWLDAIADASLLRLVVNLFIPCLVLDSILGNASLSHLRNLLVPPLLGFGSILLGFAAAWLAAPLLRGTELRTRRTFAFTVGIYNYSYIALPLVVSLFDRATLGVLFTFNLGVEIAFWTLGLLLLTAGDPAHKSGNAWRRILNPPVLSILAALVFNLFVPAAWLPHFLLAGIHSIGNIGIPLALILTGALIADWLPSLKTDFRPSIVLLSCALRLGLLPVLFLVAARWLPLSVELKRVLLIQAAMPAGMLPVVIARHYGGDAGAALQVVIGTSLLGLLTIPFWIRMGLQLVGG